MKDLSGKVAVITGAGSGIGRATALAFARQGVRLHLVDIHPGRLEEAAGQVRRLGVPVSTHQVDCADPDAMQKLAEEIFTSDGRVDILHNNAGVCCGGPMQEISREDWDWSISVNLWGPINGIRAFLPTMIRQGRGGHILNTASMAGLVGLPYVAPYCTTKFAVVGLSESLAAELAPHRIRVTAICPGPVATNVLADARIRLPGNWLSRLQGLIGRYATSPEKVAGEIVRAVRRDKDLATPAGLSMTPLWAIKRFSNTLYSRLARMAVRLASRD